MRKPRETVEITSERLWSLFLTLFGLLAVELVAILVWIE